MKIRAAAALAAAAWTAGAVAEDAPRPPGDSVTWSEQGALKTRTGVVVESAGFDQVVVVQGGRRTTLDGADVVEVRWGDAPRAFESAAAALRCGDAESALAGFEEALRDRATARGWLVEYGSLGMGEARLALAWRDRANAERAARAFTAARAANPRSLALDRIDGGLARAELLRGDTAAAIAAADDLAAAARTARRPDWEAGAALLAARGVEVKGDAAGAVAAFDGVVAFAEPRAAGTKDAGLARRLTRTAIAASVRKMCILVAGAERSPAAETADRVRSHLAEMSSKWPDDAEALAAATNAEGALLLAAGDARRALRRFQATEVLHFGVAEEAANALRYEALCYARLGDEKRRAESLRVLDETHPGSEAARRVR